VLENSPASGRWCGKLTTARGRRSVALVTCKTREEAEARREFIAEQLNRLAHRGRRDFGEKVLELASRAELGRLERVRRGVDVILAGNFEAPQSDASVVPNVGPTFHEFAEG